MALWCNWQAHDSLKVKDRDHTSAGLPCEANTCSIGHLANQQFEEMNFEFIFVATAWKGA